VDAEHRCEGLSGERADVVEADLFHYLPEHTDEFDGILASNVIEHFTTEDTLRLLGRFSRFAAGGILLLATPNPASLIVHLYESGVMQPTCDSTAALCSSSALLVWIPRHTIG